MKRFVQRWWARGRWQRVLLVVLLFTFVSQTPFIYRRYKLARLYSTIQQLNRVRTVEQETDGYRDYAGAVHVHSSLGGHSTGAFTDIIAAAKQSGLAFVLMTEHPASNLDTAAMTLNGEHGGVLFVRGSELNGQGKDRLLVIGDGRAASFTPKNLTLGEEGPQSGAEIAQAKATGKLVFVAHSEDFSSWGAPGFDGMEVYNLHASAQAANRLLLVFDGLWSLWGYGDLLWTAFYQRPQANLERWDQLVTQRGRHVVAVAGNDAHANIGIDLQYASGKKVLSVRLDPYARSFGVVRTHALIAPDQKLTQDTLLEALEKGHCYVSFDGLSDAGGFSFTASNASERRIMGDDIALQKEAHLRINTPVPSRTVLFRDGAKIGESRNTSAAEFAVKQPGVYRVEAYLEQLDQPLRDQPWIISNPIYIH